MSDGELTDTEIEQKPDKKVDNDVTPPIGARPSKTPTASGIAPQPKPKKKLTEKQLEALAKGRQKRLEAKKQEVEETKKKLEDKIVKKAIAIKKKQIKKEQVLELSESEEEAIEEDVKPSTFKKSGAKERKGHRETSVSLPRPNTREVAPAPAPAPTPAPMVEAPRKKQIVFF
jgi:hypothetical protein